MNETIIETRTLYEGRVVKLDIHQVRLPDGQIAPREVIRHQGAVALVALDAQGQVLLVRQFRIGAGRALLEIPAGVLEPDEPVEACAVRELREETGCRPERLDYLGGFYPTPGYTTEHIHLYLATGLVEDPLDGDADEFIQVERVPLAEALAMIERATSPTAKA